MGARLRIFLNPEEDRTLFELRTAQGVPQRTKDRAEVLRLNAHGWSVDQIAAYFNWAKQTVREAIHRWNTKGLGGLWDACGRGSKRRWQEADMAYLEACLHQEPRTYNSVQLAQKLAQVRQVQLSSDRIRRILQKKGLLWKRTRQSHQAKQDPIERSLKQADLEMLELAAAAGEIQLKYLDESGFCLWSPVSYSYIQRGHSKRLEQTRRRGRRLSILGLWHPLISFEYGLAVGSFKSDAYIRLLNWQAEKAAQLLAQTGQITVVVQDHGPLHTSKATQAKYRDWERQGLYIFFLPKYCSQMNPYAFGGAKPYEHQWQHLKAQELAGQMFEDEYDLALAVMDGVQARAQKGKYATERFMFNSTLAA